MFDSIGTQQIKILTTFEFICLEYRENDVGKLRNYKQIFPLIIHNEANTAL